MFLGHIRAPITWLCAQRFTKMRAPDSGCRSYLDANASEPLRPEARAAVIQTLDVVGNPSSVHAEGRHARQLLEDAREVLADCFGATASEMVFTSGGTEANSLAIAALCGERRAIVGITEHAAVRAAFSGPVHVLPVNGNGVADLGALETLLQGSPALVCLMAANNETGVLHPVAQVAQMCRAAGALLHVDAVQAAGRLPPGYWNAGDTVALSGHKLGGPLGAGALLAGPRAMPMLRPLIKGGGQERGRRGGTPALAPIAGFAAAASAAKPESAARLAPMRDEIENVARECGAVVVGGEAERLPNTTCLWLPGVKAETQVIALDLEGIAVSAGAACSSGKVGRSHVLEAMGLGDGAGEAIRVSLPWAANAEHVRAFVRAYRAVTSRLLRRAA